MTVASVGNVPQVARRTRSPQHQFNLRYRPWVIQPFLLAPVLPGETMKSLSFQSRVVSDPIKNPIIGWWTEYYFFYVKHRDMDARDTLTAMMLDYTTNVSALNASAFVQHYHAAGTFDWVEMCKKRVVMEYFRDGDETYPGAQINSMPIARINTDSWLDSAYLDDAIPDQTVPSDLTPMSLEGFEAAYKTWEFQRANQLSQMDYEDFLATYGVRQAKRELHKPELIRYVRDWTYPTNTIDPTNGTPRSAVSWSFAERASKDRYFSEPGFIFGVTCTRPKIYRTQDSHLADYMTDALSWLPAIMRDEPYTSLKKFTDTQGPLATAVTDTDGYWVDLRDLFLYGDQFLNYAPTTALVNLQVGPTGAVSDWKYATSADSTALFVDTVTNFYLKADGVVNLHILGTQSEST